MERSQRGSEWVAIRRSLAILRRLSFGPASNEELVRAVIDVVGEEAYPGSEAARQRAFKRDRENLRCQLGVSFTFDPTQKVYVLLDPGSFGCLDLTGESLKAIRLLSQSFAGEIGEKAEVKKLVDELTARLSPEARNALEGGGLPLALDISQGIDTHPIAERVWTVVMRATNERRKLSFNYISPRHEDRRPRYHQVAPYRVFLQWGHWYLYAYDLFRRTFDGQEERDTGYKRFRLTYIQEDDQLMVHPTVLPPARRKPPRYLVHYRLLPVLARGSISRHFEQMEVRYLPDSSAEVRGFTDNDWEAARLLLSYGENCVVLGGSEVLKRVERAVRGMAENYGLIP